MRAAGRARSIRRIWRRTRSIVRAEAARASILEARARTTRARAGDARASSRILFAPVLHEIRSNHPGAESCDMQIFCAADRAWLRAEPCRTKDCSALTPGRQAGSGAGEFPNIGRLPLRSPCLQFPRFAPVYRFDSSRRRALRADCAKARVPSGCAHWCRKQIRCPPNPSAARSEATLARCGQRSQAPSPPAAECARDAPGRTTV
jgi:hypothetical protein